MWLGEREGDHSSKPEVVNIALPSRPLSPACVVEQCSSDAVTRRGKLAPSQISSTLKGIPPPSCLVRVLGTLSILDRVWRTVDHLGSEHLFFF